MKAFIIVATHELDFSMEEVDDFLVGEELFFSFFWFFILDEGFFFGLSKFNHEVALSFVDHVHVDEDLGEDDVDDGFEFDILMIEFSIAIDNLLKLLKQREARRQPFLIAVNLEHFWDNF